MFLLKIFLYTLLCTAVVYLGWHAFWRTDLASVLETNKHSERLFGRGITWKRYQHGVLVEEVAADFVYLHGQALHLKNIAFVKGDDALRAAEGKVLFLEDEEELVFTATPTEIRLLGEVVLEIAGYTLHTARATYNAGSLVSDRAVRILGKGMVLTSSEGFSYLPSVDQLVLHGVVEGEAFTDTGSRFRP